MRRVDFLRRGMLPSVCDMTVSDIGDLGFSWTVALSGKSNYSFQFQFSKQSCEI